MRYARPGEHRSGCTAWPLPVDLLIDVFDVLARAIGELLTNRLPQEARQMRNRSAIGCREKMLKYKLLMKKTTTY